MRGKVPVFGALMLIGRITPAYAGKRQLSTPHTPCTEDHPRLCGEKHMEVYAICDIIGSPPPMRGKVLWSVQFTHRPGITPAYAGKSKTAAVSFPEC